MGNAVGSCLHRRTPARPDKPAVRRSDTLANIPAPPPRGPPAAATAKATPLSPRPADVVDDGSAVVLQVPDPAEIKAQRARRKEQRRAEMQSRVREEDLQATSPMTYEGEEALSPEQALAHSQPDQSHDAHVSGSDVSEEAELRPAAAELATPDSDGQVEQAQPQSDLHTEPESMPESEPEPEAESEPEPEVELEPEPEPEPEPEEDKVEEIPVLTAASSKNIFEELTREAAVDHKAQVLSGARAEIDRDNIRQKSSLSGSLAMFEKRDADARVDMEALVKQGQVKTALHHQPAALQSKLAEYERRDRDAAVDMKQVVLAGK